MFVNLLCYIGVPCRYKPAPPKTKDRSQTKASLEYYNRSWPHTKHIVDMCRCSVVFPDSQSLYNGLTKLLNGYYDGNETTNDTRVVRRIVRIKDGFGWKSIRSDGN